MKPELRELPISQRVQLVGRMVNLRTFYLEEVSRGYLNICSGG